MTENQFITQTAQYFVVPDDAKKLYRLWHRFNGGIVPTLHATMNGDHAITMRTLLNCNLQTRDRVEAQEILDRINNLL